MLPEYIYVTIGILLFISVVASKLSGKFGIPGLLIFLFIGMLAGSEGIGGIYFDDYSFAQSIGDVALISYKKSAKLGSYFCVTPKYSRFN